MDLHALNVVDQSNRLRDTELARHAALRQSHAERAVPASGGRSAHSVSAALGLLFSRVGRALHLRPVH